MARTKYSVLALDGGGILALGLTKPAARGSAKPAFSASNLLDFYLDEGEQIFPASRCGSA